VSVSGLAPPRVEACPLCRARVGSNDARCPECNMTLAGVGARAPLFTRQSIWWWAGALLALYLAVLAIVVAAR
jgi:predicted amidophosphoribosyltransferase